MAGKAESRSSFWVLTFYFFAAAWSLTNSPPFGLLANGLYFFSTV
jgi:hypothetical protein